MRRELIGFTFCRWEAELEGQNVIVMIYPVVPLAEAVVFPSELVLPIAEVPVRSTALDPM